MHPNFWHWRNWPYTLLVLAMFLGMVLLTGASTSIKAEQFILEAFLPTSGDFALITLTFIIEFIYNYRRRQLWLDLTEKMLKDQQ
ncbi:MAG: hypothetical protein ACRCWD_01970 [Culicoidibacterales bacterium]